MPLYEYACRKCHKRTERIEKYTGPHLRKCPSCGGSVERVVSAPAIQFKGTGWYVTDYARSSSAEGKSRDEGSAGSEKGAAKTEAKDDAKTAAPPKEKKKTASKEK